jgi:beta-lactamase regulating signal transducer with metallopeptidase domain
MSLLAIRLPEMIGLTILHSLWQITLLWIVLITVLRLCPKASSPIRYTLAISTLILSVLTTVATAVYEWQLHATSEETFALSNGTAQTMEIVYITVKETLLSRITDALNASVPLLAWLWCAGLVVMGARFGGSFFYLRTLRAHKNIAAISPVWQQGLKRLSRALGLRCEVAIATSARITSPLTLGSISPIILIPAGLLSGLSTAQVEAILVHELYHIKRCDYIINICQALVEVLLFYHPAIWHINNIIREERENCCDDQTLAFCGDAIAYARALTRIQEINTLTKPTLAMSATGPNAANFSNRIKRLFNVYPSPAQALSRGIFAIGFLIAYLGIVVASANVSPAGAVEPERTPMTTSVSDHNTFSNIFQDSIPVSNYVDVPDRKRITNQPVAGEKVRSTGIQHADATASGQSLDKCLQKVDLILKMAAIFRPPVDSLNFRKFSAWDSLLMAASMDHLAEKTLKLQPTRFYGTVNLSRINKLDSNDTARNGTTTDVVLESIDRAGVDSITLYNSDDEKDGVVGARLKQGTAKEILIPGFGIAQRSVRIFAGGMPLQKGTDYTVDYTLGKVIINNESILSSGKNISVQYEQSDPFAFQTRSLVGTRLDYQVNEDVNAVQVFPNATNDRLNISLTPARKGSRVKMILVDSDGNVVKEITDSIYDGIPTELHVDVSGYKKGIYILQINIDGAKSQQRVVVE